MRQRCIHLCEFEDSLVNIVRGQPGLQRQILSQTRESGNPSKYYFDLKFSKNIFFFCFFMYVYMYVCIYVRMYVFDCCLPVCLHDRRGHQITLDGSTVWVVGIELRIYRIYRRITSALNHHANSSAPLYSFNLESPCFCPNYYVSPFKVHTKSTLSCHLKAMK